jgi:hypothetical protein
MGFEMRKYDYLAQKCFHKPYAQLDRDEQITVEDEYDQKEE